MSLIWNSAGRRVKIDEAAIRRDPRPGIIWLLDNRFKEVDFDKMIGELEACERKYRTTEKSACKTCPHFPACEAIFDHKCPDTTIEEKKKQGPPCPKCDGGILYKYGHVWYGYRYLQVWRCK